MKVFFKKNLFILKLNKIKIIHDLYFQCLTQTLSKTTFFSSMREYELVPASSTILKDNPSNDL